MMMAKIARTYRLSEKTIGLIDKLKELENISSKEGAIEFVFNWYFEQQNKEERILNILEENLMAEFKKVKEDLSRIRGASNNIDRHTQMQMEFWNHHFIVNPSKELITTDKHKRKELSEADGLIKQRIAENRLKKIEYEKKKNNEL